MIIFVLQAILPCAHVHHVLHAKLYQDQVAAILTRRVAATSNYHLAMLSMQLPHYDPLQYNLYQV